MKWEIGKIWQTKNRNADTKWNQTKDGDLGPTAQGLCVQRLNIVGAPAVISTLVSHLDTTLLPSGAPVGAAAAPASPTQGQQPDPATTGPVPTSVSRVDVLADARVVLSALSQTQSLSSP